MKDNAIKVLKSGVLSWIIFLLIWIIGAALIGDDYFLPSPQRTLQGIIDLIADGTMGTDVAASLGRIVKGWLLAVFVAVPLGLLVGNFRPVRWIIEPLLSLFQFIPAIALTTLFLMWFGVGEESKIALIFYAAFFPMFVNTIAGVVSTDMSLIEAASCMGASKLRVFFTVVIPSAVSNIFTGVRLGLGSSFTCVVAAEMLVGSDGLGYLINSSKLYYKTYNAFAGIAVLAVLGFVADRLLQYIGRKALKHYGVK